MHVKKFLLVIALLSALALACAGLPNIGDLAGNAVGTALATTGLDEFVQMATMLADSGLSDEAQSMAATMMAGGTPFPLETLMAQFGDQASGAIIFQDDFSNASGDWVVESDALGTQGYYSEKYRITVSETNTVLWSDTLSGNYGDISVEVDSAKIAGPDQNEMGLLCRYSDGDFYAAGIGSDGYFSVWSRLSGEWNLLGMEEVQFSEAIYTGTQTNRIRFDCVGSSLTLYANGTQLIQVQDSSLTTGDAGVYAGSFDVGGVDVVFDNFLIAQP
ncbi:MAG: hypothetical protein KIT08_03665 [Anaerolineales bacterium]|nr:MAG: hypothetical protein KIT08_03665 [Anaerolineales bacterium]